MTDADWDAFELSLGTSLGTMAEETFLVVETTDSTERPNYYVQFAMTRDSFRAEAVSSAYLPYRWKFSRRQISRLLGFGWQRAPKGEKGRNYFLMFQLPPPTTEVASLAIRTLRDVYGIQRPAELSYSYESFEHAPMGDLQLPIERRPLTAPSARKGAQRGDLTELVEEGLRKWLAIDGLVTDRDRDYPIRVGSALVYVRLLGEPTQAVLLFSPILQDVEVTPALLAAINDLNAAIRGGRVFAHRGMVIVANELPALDLTADQVGLGCLDLGVLADRLDDALHGRFGGKLMFSNQSGLPN